MGCLKQRHAVYWVIFVEHIFKRLLHRLQCSSENKQKDVSRMFEGNRTFKCIPGTDRVHFSLRNSQSGSLIHIHDRVKPNAKLTLEYNLKMHKRRNLFVLDKPTNPMYYFINLLFQYIKLN